jgi:steroid delta-isomerase-like uncharacterized protein
MSAGAKEIAYAWFQRVWNEGDESAIDELCGADSIAHGLPTPDGQPMRGPAAFKPFFHKFRCAFSDLKVTIRQTVTEGDMCAVYCEVEGIHSSDSIGIPATNCRVSFTGMTLIRVKGGQIQEGWNSYDFLSLYQQLGVIPVIGT